MTSESAPTKTPALWRKPPVFRLLVIALLAEIGYAVLNFSTMALYLTSERKFSESYVGLALSIYLLCEAIFKGPMGALADRLGHKRLIGWGPAITIFTCLLTLAIPHNAGYFEGIGILVLRAFDGLGAAMIWPALFAQMGETCHDGERHSAMSLLNLCYLAGIAISFSVGGVINDLTGSHAASIWLSGGLFLIASTLTYIFVPSGKDQRERYKVRVSDGQKRDKVNILRSFTKIPAYIILAIITFMGTGFPMAVVKLFAKDQFKLSESQFGLLALPAIGAMALCSVPISRMGSKLGRNKAMHYGLGLCVAGMAVLSLGAFVDIFRTTVVLALAIIPVGIGFLMAIPAWYTSVSELDPDSRASNIGAVMTAQGIGAIVGAIVGSKLYEKTDLFGTTIAHYMPFIGCTACILIGWLMSLRLLHDSPTAMPK